MCWGHFQRKLRAESNIHKRTVFTRARTMKGTPLSPGRRPAGSRGLSARAASGELRLWSFNRPGPGLAGERRLSGGRSWPHGRERAADSEPQSVCLSCNCHCCTIACNNQGGTKITPLDFCRSWTSAAFFIDWRQINKHKKKEEMRDKSCSQALCYSAIHSATGEESCYIWGTTKIECD